MSSEETSGLSASDEELSDEDMPEEVIDMPLEERDAFRRALATLPDQSVPATQRERRKRPVTGAPIERSSKSRPRRIVRNPFPSATRHSRDPRFEDLCGDLDEARWADSYSWLDDHAADETSRVRNALRRRKQPADADPEAMQAQLTQLQQFKSARSRSKAQRAARGKRRHAAEEAVADGRRPFFPKRAQAAQDMREELYGSARSAERAHARIAVRRDQRKRRRSALAIAHGGKRRRLDVTVGPS